MKPPRVAIVGRPNVGKSTLFNALARRRVSIVEPSSGVTRDRVSTLLTSPDGVQIELVDTGGMGVGDQDALAENVEEQIRRAVERADVLVLTVDASEGLLPQDREIAATLRALGKPLVLVANKVDSPAHTAAAAEFHALGLGEPIAVSALHKKNTGEVRSRLFGMGAQGAGAPAQMSEMKIAVVGQRNVGKSTFVNALADEERMIVSEVAGTTRDSVDVRFELNGKVFIAIDTAGVRKKRQVASSVEFFSRVRAEESIRRANVVLHMFDARNKVSQVDKVLAGYIERHSKPCVLVVNKWDLAGDIPTGRYVDYLTAELPGLGGAPVAFVSALKDRGVRRTIDAAQSIWKQAKRRVRTADLNTAINELKKRARAGTSAVRRPKIYYGTQVGVEPPTIVLFVNSPESFSRSHRRFVANFLRSELSFSEVPIVVRYKKATGDRHA